MITVSVVSHGQASLVEALLGDLVLCAGISRIVVTVNIPDRQPAVPSALEDKVVWRSNEAPLGFAANHDRAFVECDTPYYCVLNPDIRLTEDPFPSLLETFLRGGITLCAPAVFNPEGQLEDSARRFPTPWGLLRKAFGGDDGRYAYRVGDSPFSPDWVAGMFMLFPAAEFERLGGFDPRYFLYYEDVDICARIRKSGGTVMLCPSAVVCHNAQRASRKSLRYMRWHVASLLRYLRAHWL